MTGLLEPRAPVGSARNDPGNKTSRRRHLAVLVTSVLLWLLAYLLGFTREVDPIGVTELLWAISFLPLQIVGVLVLRARAKDVVGRSLLYSPLLIALGIALFSYGERGLALSGEELSLAANAWPATDVSFFLGELVFTIGNGGLILGLYRFPDGRTLGGVWRLGERVLIVTMVIGGVGVILVPSLEQGLEDRALDVTNPFVGRAAEGVAPIFEVVGLLFVVAVVLGMASLAARYRRGTTVTRLQLRWVLQPILVGALLLGLIQLADALLGMNLGRDNGPASVVVSIVFTVGIPAGIVMAITRARLYEIDRLISRTLAYAVLTAVLVGVYALGVLGVGALLPGEGSDLLVAGSTLAVAALFRPLRSRIQDIVDRRFNRARYDALRIAEAFSSRLRGEIDLGALRTDLLQTARSSVEPTAASLWLAP